MESAKVLRDQSRDDNEHGNIKARNTAMLRAFVAADEAAKAAEKAESAAPGSVEAKEALGFAEDADEFAESAKAEASPF